jgi:hypothetical protein
MEVCYHISLLYLNWKLGWILNLTFESVQNFKISLYNVLLWLMSTIYLCETVLLVYKVSLYDQLLAVVK